MTHITKLCTKYNQINPSSTATIHFFFLQSTVKVLLTIRVLSVLTSTVSWRGLVQMKISFINM